MSTVFRWILVVPAAIAAYMIVIVAVVLTQAAAGMYRPAPRDTAAELVPNVLAAFISVGVAILVAPAQRTKIAVAWIAVIFAIACYGNLINGAGIVPAGIS